VSDNPFLFSMRLAGTGEFDVMVADLASNVLTHLGFAPAAIDELTGELRAGLPAGTADGAELYVQFQVRDDEIEIVLSQRDRSLCRVSRRLP
jgi:hypothetical protein